MGAAEDAALSLPVVVGLLLNLRETMLLVLVAWREYPLLEQVDLEVVTMLAHWLLAAAPQPMLLLELDL